MKKIHYLIIGLLCMMAQGAWAQTNVATEDELNNAVQTDGANIKLTADIALSNYLGIGDGDELEPSVTIDLNGYTLSRSLSASDGNGHVIWVRTGSTLYVMDSSGNNSGKLTGGWANNGGGICNYGTLYFQGGTITGCKASSTGGAIRNNGDVYFEGGVIDDNEGADCGGIYNAEGATLYFDGGTIQNCTSNSGGGGIVNYGTAEITGGTIKDNSAKSRGGGLWNGTNATLTVSGGTITGNTSENYGGGLFSYSSFKMSGKVVIKNNTVNGVTNNLYLHGGSSVIKVIDAFTSGTSIGISRDESDYNKKFTSGFNSKNSGSVATDFFSPDVSGAKVTTSDGEAYLSTNSGVFYIDRSWTGGDTDGHVVSTRKIATGVGTFSGAESVSKGWYLISGSKKYDSKRVSVTGEVHFILQDGCDLELTKGIYIKAGSHLYIYGQSNGTGKLRCTGGDGDNAAIGGNDGNRGGRLTVYGGYVKAHASSNNAAGIGGGNHGDSGMQSFTIFGGEVDAYGQSSAAGIGGGQQNNSDNHPVVKIYGGKVTAKSEDYGAGIGGGEDRNGCDVYIYGGTVTAKGGAHGAGIGGGEDGSNKTTYIYGGTVTAKGGSQAAGIGGGRNRNGGTVYIYGGTTTATAGSEGSGVGGGDEGAGANVYIYGGTITAKNVEYGWAFGGGHDCNQNGSVTLGDNIQVRGGGTNGGLVSKDNRVSYLMSSGERTAMECTHESGLTYADKDESYHRASCSYCNGFDEVHSKGDDSKCPKCGRGMPQRAFTFYESKSSGRGYSNNGTTYYVTEDTEFTFPSCNKVPTGLMFAGWEESDEAPSNIKVESAEGLIKADSVITLPLFSSDRKYYARYMDIAFSGGSGSEADPFIISTTDDFSDLATAIGKGYDFKDFYIALTDDLDFSDKTFTPIGTENVNFNGNFDGQGHTIKGISLSNSNSYQGIFGYMDANGIIQNLTLDDSSIKGGSHTGAIVGRSQGTIKNCHVTNSVTVGGNGSVSYIGGIVGYSKGTIEGCTSEATVGSKNNTKVGGIAGYGGNTIQNNLFLGSSISGSKYVGAIVGQDYSTSMTSCYYAAANGLPKAAGTSSSSKDKNGAKAGYSVSSGTEGLTLSYGETTAAYDYDGIKAYSFGLLYGDKLYAASGASVNFNAGAPEGKTAANVTASAGTLVANEDESYTLVMTSSDAVITAELEEVSLVSFTDGVDNTIVLAAFDGEMVDVEYDRELTTGENGESTAYTVCIPYDFDAEEYTAEEDDEDDEDAATARRIRKAPEYDAVIKVFTLAAVDKEKQQFIFTDAPAYMPAGSPVVIVVYEGSIWLNAEGVILNSLAGEGQPVYPSYEDYLNQSEDVLGYWKGSFETFRAFFEALETTEVGTYKAMYQPEDGELQDFPAERFADPIIIDGEAVGISDATRQGEMANDNWFDLQGRKLSTPAAKGVYIKDGRKIVKP